MVGTTTQDAILVDSDVEVIGITPTGEEFDIPYTSLSYDDGAIDISTTPVLNVTVPNDQGRFTGKFNTGTEVEVYLNGSLDFRGVVEPRTLRFEDKDKGEIDVEAHHKAWSLLRQHQCDTYEYSESDNGLADAIVNPWEWRIFRDRNGSVNDVGQFPSVHGWRPDQIVEQILGTKILHQNFIADGKFFLLSTFGSDTDMAIYKDDRAGQVGPALQLTYQGADSFPSTEQTVESIPIYNGDPNVDAMGDVSTVNVTIYGQAYTDGGGTRHDPSIDVCRNADQSSRTYTSATLDSFTDQASSDLDKWEYSVDLSSDGASVKNELGYRVGLNSDGSGTSWVTYIAVEAVTESDTDITTGTVETYEDTSFDDTAGNTLDDGKDIVALNVNGKSRLDALSDMRSLTISDPAKNPNPHWDIILTPSLTAHFKERHGAVLDDEFSFGDSRGHLRVLEHEYEGDQVYYQVYGLGAGSGIARTKFVTKQDFSDGGAYIPDNDPDEGAKYGDAAKIGKYENSNIIDETTLLKRMRSFLKLHRDPVEVFRVEIEADYVDWVGIGDSIQVREPLSTGKDKIRVQRRTKNFSPDSVDTWDLELGEPQVNIADDMGNLQGQIQGVGISRQPQSVQEAPTNAPIQATNTEPGIFTFDVTDPKPGDRWLLSVKTTPWQSDVRTAEAGGQETSGAGGATLMNPDFSDKSTSVNQHDVGNQTHDSTTGLDNTGTSGSVTNSSTSGTAAGQDVTGRTSTKQDKAGSQIFHAQRTNVSFANDGDVEEAEDTNGISDMNKIEGVKIDVVLSEGSDDDWQFRIMLQDQVATYDEYCEDFVSSLDNDMRMQRVYWIPTEVLQHRGITSITACKVEVEATTGSTQMGLIDIELVEIPRHDHTGGGLSGGSSSTSGSLDNSSTGGIVNNDDVSGGTNAKNVSPGGSIDAPDLTALIQNTEVGYDENDGGTGSILYTVGGTDYYSQHEHIVDDHTHPLEFGIYQFDGDGGDGTGTPVLGTKVEAWIDPDNLNTVGAPGSSSRGKLPTTFGRSGEQTGLKTFDITPFLETDSNGVIKQETHEIRFLTQEGSAPNAEGLVTLEAKVEKVSKDYSSTGEG